MPDVATLAREVLNDAYLMTLAVNDAQGPWAAPVIFVTDSDMKLYWLSKPETRHSMAIAASGHVGISIAAAWKKGEERAVQIEAVASKVEGQLFEQEKALRLKVGDMPPAVAGETTTGHLWYVAMPKRVELIHEKHFGWDRQRVL